MSATLKVGEYHPCANNAMSYIRCHIIHPFLIESLASTALSGNRTAEICLSTIRRIEKGEPVSDRYVLGLAWCLKEMVEDAQRQVGWNYKGESIDFSECGKLEVLEEI